MNAEDTANHILVDVICWAIRGQPQLSLRRFNSTTASMSSLLGPLGQADACACAKTTCGTFVWPARGGDAARVDGFRTMAERSTRAGFIKRVHRPAMKRSAGRRLGARLRPRWRMRSPMNESLSDSDSFLEHLDATQTAALVPGK